MADSLVMAFGPEGPVILLQENVTGFVDETTSFHRNLAAAETFRFSVFALETFLVKNKLDSLEQRWEVH